VKKLVFLDETGCQANMARTHTWGKKGQRTIVHQSYGRCKNVTVIGAVSVSGPVGMRTMEKALDSESFENFLADVLLPRMKPGSVLVMDNLAVHKSRGALELLRKSKIKIRKRSRPEAVFTKETRRPAERRLCRPEAAMVQVDPPCWHVKRR
jgi:hypothetical protein